MSGYENFRREYRLSVGKAGSEGFEVGETSASQPIPLHISFSMQKSDLKTPNTGKVTVWNLNRSHLSALNKKNCVLSLKAGYGDVLPLIFTGVINYASTTADGADRKTEIEVVDNPVSVKNTIVSVSYKGTVNWKEIIKDTAAQMGVAVSFSYNVKFKDIHNGFSFVGKAKKIIDKACKSCKLAWSIQNGVLQIKKPGDVMSKECYELSSKTGLIGVPARVVVSQDDETKKNKLGWDVVYFLNGAINIDDYVKLKSDTVTGYFRVYSLEIQGDNISGDWICKARLLEVK